MSNLEAPPRWLRLKAILAAHDKQIGEHGGLAGIRDMGALDSALARPENYFGYGDKNVFRLAAVYATGIVKNHPFVDGNKRTGFLAAYGFLRINGYALRVAEAEAAIMTKQLASSDISESQFAAWLEDNSKADTPNKGL